MANKYMDENAAIHFWLKIKEVVKSWIPTKLSQLTNDKDYITRTDAEGTYLKKVDKVSPTWENITGKPDVAVKATTLSGYGIADAYTKSQVDGLVSSALRYKGTKTTYAELPTSGNKIGDVWNITKADKSHSVKAGDNVAWNGNEWDILSGTVDLSEYLLASSVITNDDIDRIVKGE